MSRGPSGDMANKFLANMTERTIPAAMQVHIIILIQSKGRHTLTSSAIPTVSRINITVVDIC